MQQSDLEYLDIGFTSIFQDVDFNPPVFHKSSFTTSFRLSVEMCRNYHAVNIIKIKKGRAILFARLV